MNNLREYLEEQMDLRRVCTIRFVGDNGGIAVIRSRIANLIWGDKGDIVRTDEGLDIGLEKIIGVNDRRFNPNC